MQMKERFLNAIITGELGKQSEFGVLVTLKEFKSYFSDINSAYVNSFLPAAVIEPGQYNISYTRYIFRVKKGLYRVHPQAIEEQIMLNAQTLNTQKGPRIEDEAMYYRVEYFYLPAAVACTVQASSLMQ